MQRAPIFSKENPVLQAEFRYQRFVIERGRVGWVWIVLAALMVIPAMIASLAYSGLAILSIPIDTLPQSARSALDAGITVMLVINLSMYPVVTLITLGLSSNSIQREKTGGTWDVLRLTDLNGYQIVFGKWWASMRALRGDHIMVTILRVGLIAAWIHQFLPFLISAQGFPIPDYRLIFLAMIPLTLAYSVLDSALTAALGVVATIPDAGEGAIIASLAVVVRVMSAVLAALLFANVMSWLQFSAGRAFVHALAGLMAYILLVMVTLLIARELVRRL